MPRFENREQLHRSLGRLFGYIHEAQAFAEEAGEKGIADDLFMLNKELLRIRGSIYTQRPSASQLVLKPHGDCSSGSDHPREVDRPA